MNYLKTLFLLLLSILLLTTTAQPPIGVGEWRAHLPYKNTKWVTDAGDNIYCVGNVAAFSVDKETGNMSRLDKANGLSDVEVSLAEYNRQYETLVIAYENTNIDLLRNNTITNISDIKRKNIIGEKQINHIYFIDSLAYLSTGFGIVVLDIVNDEIKDTYIIGASGENININGLTSDSARFFAATEEGVKVASISSPFLTNFREWELQTNGVGLPAKEAKHIVTFDDKVYTNIDDTIYVFDGNSWNYYYSQGQWLIDDVNASEDYLIISERNADEGSSPPARVVLFDTNDVLRIAPNDRLRQASRTLMDDQGFLWTAGFLEGLQRFKNGQVDLFIPNGPGATRVHNMALRNGTLYVAPGGISSNCGHLFNHDGFYYFNGNWDTKSQWSGIPELQGLLSIITVAIHPSQDKVYLGTFWDGLLEIDHGEYTLYNKDNSILEKDNGDIDRTKITGLAFDQQQNLWISNYHADDPIAVIKPDGTWLNFKPNIGSNINDLTQIVIDDLGQKWIVLCGSQGILVYNHGTDIDSPGDDLYKHMRSGDGFSNLHTSNVLCLAKDRDGEMWVGTSEGITVFYCPTAVFTDGCQAQRILVTQPDGFTGYLLETENVNTIAVDGANRKWVGTSNGVFVLSPDGTEEVAYFTEKNSPLLSNEIISIAIDDNTGEVFIGTDKGIISYRGEAIDGGEDHGDVLVFPNPVKEDYHGPIAIKGLVENADVKITDASGHLIYQTTALGGQAIWDGKNLDGNRAKTGVYFIFSTNEDGSSKHVAKLLMIN